MAMRLVLIMAAAFLAALATPPDARAQTPPSFEECAAAVDEDALRREAIAGAQSAISNAVGSVDYAAIVDDAWRAARFDRRFERLVDEKIEIIREDRNFIERLADATLPNFAEDIAERTTSEVFESSEFEALQVSLMKEISDRLQPVFQVADQAAEDVAAECVRVYLGARYAEIVQTALADELAGAAGDEVELSVGATGASGNIASIVGALLLVAFRRVVRRVIEATVRRLVGAVAARIASWTTIVLGVAVLTYDVIVSSDGVFPVIREELLSVETSADIQRTIIEELEAVGVDALDGRAAEIGDEMVRRWRAFEDNHRAVLALAEREPRFAQYLEQIRPQEFEKLSTLVALIGAEGGDAAVMAALDSGELPRAMRIPFIDTQAAALAEEGVDLSELVGWADVAGADYATAVDYGLPTILDPTAIDRAGVRALLGLDTPAQARKVAGLGAETRDTLLRLSPDQLRALAGAFSGPELEAVMGALAAAPDAGARRLYLDRIVERPGQALALTSPNVAGVIEDSRSPERALAMLLDPASRWDPFTFADHVGTVAEGEVAPLALAHRYGWAGAALLAAPLLILLGFLRMVFRVFAPRRRY